MKMLDRYMDYAVRGGKLREASTMGALAFAICLVTLLAIYLPIAMFGAESYAVMALGAAASALGCGIGVALICGAIAE